MILRALPTIVFFVNETSSGRNFAKVNFFLASITTRFMEHKNKKGSGVLNLSLTIYGFKDYFLPLLGSCSVKV
jgi:hypothetical protein